MKKRTQTISVTFKWLTKALTTPGAYLAVPWAAPLCLCLKGRVGAHTVVAVGPSCARSVRLTERRPWMCPMCPCCDLPSFILWLLCIYSQESLLLLTPFRGAHLRTSISVGNQGCLLLSWLAQMNYCRCHQVFSTKFSCLWTNLLFCLSAFVLGTSAIPELKQTYSPET